MSKPQNGSKFDETEAHRPIVPSPTINREYNMNYKSRGIALIFNHYRIKIKDVSSSIRKGTKKDVAALRYRGLPLLGFEPENIIIENDLTKDQIINYWDELKRAKYDETLRNCDCIMIFILSHGMENNKICARDSVYDLYNLIDQYTAENFKELAGKPKLFFVNACRGKEIDPGGLFLKNASCCNEIKQANNQTLLQLQNNYPSFVVTNLVDACMTMTIDQQVSSHSIYADTLIGMSCYYQHISFRNTKKGSWYIQDLCLAIKEFKILNKLETADLTEILVRTNFLVAQRESSSENEAKYSGRKQIPNYNSSLCRKIIFRTKNV